jgi:hypothetical protein
MIKHGMVIGKKMILAKFYLNLCLQGKKRVVLLLVHKHIQKKKGKDHVSSEVGVCKNDTLGELSKSFSDSYYFISLYKSKFFSG